MKPICRFLPCCLIALVAGFFAPGLEKACAQTRDAVAPGPTRASLTPGVMSMAAEGGVSSMWIRHRYDAFEDDFSEHFGLARPLEKGEVVAHLSEEVAARWGETRWYDWVKRGLAMYARFQAMTETEHRGFDMEFETDDLPEGKVGVRVTRALE
ncbi:MAG: hypothetical protein R3326_03325 [Gemmatimonadota bacterium]|nr:hypothetical protein [Gemmatimonadota bacterium]